MGRRTIEFVNHIVNYLTEHGTMPVARLYEPPYTDFHPLGGEGTFPETEVEQLIDVLHEIRSRASA